MIYLLTPGLNAITEYVMGLIYPGRPIANISFKVYGYMSMNQAVSFLNDFKLGHYIKIPPRSMFLVQVNTFSPQKKKKKILYYYQYVSVGLIVLTRQIMQFTTINL